MCLLYFQCRVCRWRVLSQYRFLQWCGPTVRCCCAGMGFLERRSCSLVGGVIGLLAEGSLEEAVGDGSLAGTSALTAPEASELGGLYCVTRHGELDEVPAGEECSGEI